MGAYTRNPPLRKPLTLWLVMWSKGGHASFLVVPYLTVLEQLPTRPLTFRPIPIQRKGT